MWQTSQKYTEKETEKEMDIPSDAVFTAGREKNEKEMDIPSDAVFTAGAGWKTTLPEAHGAAHRKNSH